MSKQALVNNFEEATWHNEYPMPDLNYTGKSVLSNAPDQHGWKVVLTGEGSDEHFAGYSMFLFDYLAEIDHSQPDYNLTYEERHGSWDWARQASTYFFKIDDAVEKTAEEALNTSSKRLNSVASLSAIGVDFPKIFNSYVSQYSERNVQKTIANSINGRIRDLMMSKWQPVHTVEYIWSKGFLSNAILTALGDRAEMAHSLEVQPPFLDHHFTEYINQPPPSVKIRWDPIEGRFSEE